jgi:hypothetical protein
MSILKYFLLVDHNRYITILESQYYKLLCYKYLKGESKEATVAEDRSHVHCVQQVLSFAAVND